MYSILAPSATLPAMTRTKRDAGLVQKASCLLAYTPTCTIQQTKNKAYIKSREEPGLVHKALHEASPNKKHRDRESNLEQSNHEA